jgi:hypothetical protein
VKPSPYKTVGEMIAAHHWRDAWPRAKREEQAFRNTLLGRALTHWENALAHAWQADCRESISDKALNAAWEREAQARLEFRSLLRIAMTEAGS